MVKMVFYYISNFHLQFTAVFSQYKTQRGVQAMDLSADQLSNLGRVFSGADPSEIAETNPASLEYVPLLSKQIVSARTVLLYIEQCL